MREPPVCGTPLPTPRVVILSPSEWAKDLNAQIHGKFPLDDSSLKWIRKKRKEASQVFSPPCYSPFGESD